MFRSVSLKCAATTRISALWCIFCVFSVLFLCVLQYTIYDPFDVLPSGTVCMFYFLGCTCRGVIKICFFIVFLMFFMVLWVLGFNIES